MVYISWNIVADVVIGLVIFTLLRVVLTELFGPSLRALELFFTSWLQRAARGNGHPPKSNSEK